MARQLRLTGNAYDLTYKRPARITVALPQQQRPSYAGQRRLDIPFLTRFEIIAALS